MASEPEPEPDFSHVANLGIFEKNPYDVPEEHTGMFIDALQPENLDADVILGDTNSKVPGRIKGKLRSSRSSWSREHLTKTYALQIRREEGRPLSKKPS